MEEEAIKTVLNKFEPDLHDSATRCNEKVADYFDYHLDNNRKDGWFGLRRWLWDVTVGNDFGADAFHYADSLEDVDYKLKGLKLKAEWMLREAFENRGLNFEKEWESLRAILHGQWGARAEFKDFQKLAKEAVAAAKATGVTP